MAKIEWQPIYSVNVSKMDEQHKKLIKLVSDLQDAMNQKKGDVQVAETLKQLRSYTVNHFADEEALMAKYGYPDLTNHKKLHKELVAKVDQLEKDMKAGGKLVVVNVMMMLNEWLFGHITKADKLYGPYLNEKGER